MNGNDVCAYSLNQLSPSSAAAHSVIKVAILGAESTGKSTLCRDLAAHFDTQCVPEYMREYLQAKWDTEQKTCEWHDLLPIAQGQIALENQMTAQVAHGPTPYLFCDTTLFELMVYANWYYGDCPEVITQAALAHHYDLVLLTEVDVPWEADDLRDAPHQRDEIAQRFADELTYHDKLFRRIGGDRQARVAQVIDWLSELS